MKRDTLRAGLWLALIFILYVIACSIEYRL